MVQIVITTTGDEIIGELNHQLTNVENHYIMNPMYIVGRRDEYGTNAMRLRSVLLLSDDEHILIPKRYVVATYSPSKMMEEYYIKAVEFDKKHGRPEINGQIEAAIVSLESFTKEEDDRMKSLSTLITKLAGQRKLH